MTTPAPIALAALPPEWLAERREIIARDGVAVRAGLGPWIEVQSINTGAWLKLALPGGAVEFMTFAERDAALAELHAPRPRPDVDRSPRACIARPEAGDDCEACQ